MPSKSIVLSSRSSGVDISQPWQRVIHDGSNPREARKRTRQQDAVRSAPRDDSRPVASAFRRTLNPCSMIIGNVDRSRRRTSAARPRTASPSASSGTYGTSSTTWDAVAVGLRRARPARSARSPRCRARSTAGADRLLAALRICATRSASSNTRCGISRRSGHDQDQRDNQINAQPPAGADSLRQGGAGRPPGSIPNCSRFR